jgi:transposase InsO family protein
LPAQTIHIHTLSVPPNDSIDWENDILIFPTEEYSTNPDNIPLHAYTAYKRVGQKVHPVSGTFPEEARVMRRFPENPLDSLPKLTPNPPEFVPTERLTEERIESLSVNPNNFLWPEEEKLFLHILKLNEATLPYEEKDRGTLRRDYFSDYIMATIPHTPWEFKNIPIPPGIRDKVIELLRSKIEAGVYEPSQSSYRGRWFCVLKKNGTLRIVHDLQPLNKVSIRDAGQLPILDDFVESYSARQCYTVFDLFWGFDGRIVDPRSRDMTAFYTPLGLLRLTALPMGYTNSPAEFQQCMTFILQDEIPHVANIFIDDLPIKGPKSQYLDQQGNPETLRENPGIRRFIWEHAQDVHRVMHRIKHAGATFSPKKSQICRPEVVIVGQKCTPQGRLPDDDRVKKILNWPVLKTVKEVRGFLGLCGTVRIWIKNYSELARPLTQLVRKGVEFTWTEERQQSFDTLKKLVSSPPALRPIDYTSERPVTLQVDTSNIAIGMILSQEDEQGRLRPSRYGSIPLNERESRYSQPKLELYGLFRALRAWRLYLIGVKNLVVDMDAIAVKGIINKPDIHPNNTINRWIQGVLLYDFQFKHVPASKFLAPDALSRRRPGENEEVETDDDSWLDDIALMVTMSYPLPPPIFNFYRPTHLPYNVFLLPSAQAKLSTAEQKLLDIKNFLESLTIPDTKSLQERKRFLKSTADYFLKKHEEKNIMYKKNGNQAPCVVVFNSKKRLAILTQAHENLGHKGEEAVYSLIRLRFYWPHMRTDVHHHVASCHECQIRSTKRMELPVTISAPTTVFQKVYIDVMYMPMSGGKRYIVAAKDDLTGVTEVRALTANNSERLAKFFEEQIYLRYGVVGQVTTDNGGEVKGAFEILMKRLGIPQVRITSYNKHANGVVERGHYILREAIIKSCKKNTDGTAMHWETKVNLAMFADRITVSSVTGFSPYYLLHGMHPLLPFDLFEATFLVEDFKAGISTSELLALRIRQLEKHDNDIERASEVLQLARLRSKEQFNRRYAKRLQKSDYPVGSLVLIRNIRLEEQLNSFKIHPRYLGPFQVIRKTARGNYIVSELDGTIHKEPYAAFRLLSYIRRDDPILINYMPDHSGSLDDRHQYREPDPESESD